MALKLHGHGNIGAGSVRSNPPSASGVPHSSCQPIKSRCGADREDFEAGFGEHRRLRYQHAYAVVGYGGVGDGVRRRVAVDMTGAARTGVLARLLASTSASRRVALACPSPPRQTGRRVRRASIASGTGPRQRLGSNNEGGRPLSGLMDRIAVLEAAGRSCSFRG